MAHSGILDGRRSTTERSSPHDIECAPTGRAVTYMPKPSCVTSRLDLDWRPVDCATDSLAALS